MSEIENLEQMLDAALENIRDENGENAGGAEKTQPAVSETARTWSVQAEHVEASAKLHGELEEAVVTVRAETAVMRIEAADPIENPARGSVAETESTPPQGEEQTVEGKPAELTVQQEAEKPQNAEEPEGSGKDAEETRKVKVIGVRFRTAGKVYYFDPGDFPVKRGSHVIVETARGVEYGTVAGIPMELEEKRVKEPLRGVIRMASQEDSEREQLNREKEREAYRICQQKIREHGLEMKLIDAEYTFDNSKVLFYFTADGRVDFRNLVKDLAGVFRTRIELRQIGVRDETKILGGYGICGRPLCCHTWLSDFVPVSIKMAKEQNLSLNPGKISGVCGRLMCCLKNEAETYEELNKNLPRVGDEVQGKDGLSGLVESVNVLRQTVRILVEVDDEKEYHEYEVGDITILRRRRRGSSRSRKDSGGGKAGKGAEGSVDNANGNGGRSKENSASAQNQSPARESAKGRRERGRRRNERRRSGAPGNDEGTKGGAEHGAKNE